MLRTPRKQHKTCAAINARGVDLPAIIFWIFVLAATLRHLKEQFFHLTPAARYIFLCWRTQIRQWWRTPGDDSRLDGSEWCKPLVSPEVLAYYTLRVPILALQYICTVQALKKKKKVSR